MPAFKKVLLLNPPGKGLYIRDYYCSKTSRTGYLFPPIDLLTAGALFRRQGWLVSALDSIASCLSPEETFERILQLRPEAIFTLTGAVSFTEDLPFLRSLRNRLPGVTLIGSGDILLERGDDLLREGVLDAVVHDFSSESMVHFAQGLREGLSDISFIGKNVAETADEEGKSITRAGGNKRKIVSIGVPPHELFRPFSYRLPFARHHPISTLLTDFGCPFTCQFCVMSGLPYHYRPMEEIAEELRYLRFLGIREFLLLDQTFGVNEERASAFLNLLTGPLGTFSWTCFSRPDTIDRHRAFQMKSSGCHTVILGVESASENTLKSMRKGFTVDQVRAAFKACRESELETVATAIIGLPGETRADIERTYELLAEISPDYLSLHVAVPRSGTGLRATMIKAGTIDPNQEIMDQSGIEHVLPSDMLSADEIAALQRRLNWRFYLRPRYLLQAIRRFRNNPWMLVRQCSDGLAFLAKTLKYLPSR